MADFVEDGEPELVVRAVTQAKEDHCLIRADQPARTACLTIPRCSEHDESDPGLRQKLLEPREEAHRLRDPRQTHNLPQTSAKRIRIPFCSVYQARIEFALS